MLTTIVRWSAAASLLVACDAGGAGGGEPSASGHYDLAMTVTRADPCPPFDVPDSLAFTISAGGAGLLGTADDGGVMIADVSAVEDGLGDDRWMRVELVSWQTWYWTEGNAWVDLHHQLVADPDGAVNGTASTHFYWEGDRPATCGFELAITGVREGS